MGRTHINVFEYTDYRKYLKEAFEERRLRNSAFSVSAFLRKAGFGVNSRGYFKLILEGRRNLSPHTLLGFAQALGLEAKESMYFENLVYYNQSKTPKEREFYFGRLSASAEGNESKEFVLLKSQHTYYSHWYMVAVRQLVGLEDFREDTAWIAAQLRNKITPEQAQEALDHLTRIGLLRRDPQGQLIQSELYVKYAGGTFSEAHRKYQDQMLDRAKESLYEDDYSERYISSVTLSCSRAQMDDLKAVIDRFRDEAFRVISSRKETPDTVFQMGVELFQLTPIKSPKKEKRK